MNAAPRAGQDGYDGEAVAGHLRGVSDVSSPADRQGRTIASSPLDSNAEEWRSIPGFPHYEASSLGNIRRGLRLRVLSTDTRGYQRITMRGGIARAAFVHRLVAAAFLGPSPVGADVNHKNGICNYNRPENLEYCTRGENIRHAVRTGLHPSGVRHGMAKLDARAVDEIRLSDDTLGQLAARHGVSKTQISRIRKGQRWKAKGR